MQKLGIYVGIEISDSFEDRIAAIKETGFDFVCLNFEEGFPLTPDWETQLKIVNKYALPVENVHLTGAGMNTIWQDNAEGEYVKNRLIKEIEGLFHLGIKCGVAHVTWGKGLPTMSSFEIGLERFKEIANIAEKYQVQLALENSVYPQFLRCVLDNIQSPYIGFCYDSGHENAFSPRENYLRSYSNRLFAMHLHDNHGDEDEHLIPLQGTINWLEKVGELKQCSLFNEQLVLESVAHGENLYDYLQLAHQAAKKLASL